MKWKPVNNTSRLQPPSGEYADWKMIIARDCSRQCVYCAIHESLFGGIRNFTIDHYRPRSLFEELMHIITNLYLACGVCNAFKGDDWPNEPALDHSLEAYPDPGGVDYNTIFQIANTHEVVGLTTASRYVVERLFLNRPQLIIERWHHSLESRIDNCVAFATKAFRQFEKLQVSDKEGLALLARLGAAICDLSAEHSQIRKTVPYDDKDVRRPKKRRTSRNQAAGTSRRRR